jgi:hypothetical protein
MVAESETTLFVAIAGTKQLRDLITDINILQNTLPTGTTFFPHSPQTTSNSVPSSQSAAAHAGFMSRSIHLASSIESLYLQAHSKGLRFVICGHSLGGAVATLCLLRLLENLSEGIQNNSRSSNNTTDSFTHHHQQQWPVQAICFGTPAIGNHQLAEYIRNHGWDVYFQYYNTPEDPVPRLFLSRTITTTPSPSHGKQDIPPPVPNADNVSTEVEDTRALEELASSAELNGFESQVEEEDTTATTAVVIAEDSTTTTTTRYGLFEKAKNAVKMISSSRGTQKQQQASGLLVLPTIRLPSFTHFGEVHYLSNTGQVHHHHHHHHHGILALTASTASSSGGLPSTRQGWFAAHRMKLYRERLALCFFSPEDTGTDHNELGGIVMDTSLVPLPVIDKAETVLPILQTDERSLVNKKRHKVQVAIKGREGLEFITQITICFPSTITISTTIPNDEDLRIKAVQIDNTQVKEQLLIKLASAGKDSNKQRRRRRRREWGKDRHIISQHLLATFLVPTSVLLGLKNTSKDTEMVVLEVCTDFAKTQVPITLHAQTAWIVGNRELSGWLFDQLRRRADAKRQQATMAAEAGSSAFPSAAAKLIAKAYKGRSPKRKENSSLEIIQKTEEEEEDKTQGAKPAPTGFSDWSTAASWSSWLKKWEVKTTTSPPAPTLLFNGIAITDMTPYFSSSSSIMATIKAATKALQRYKRREEEEGEEYIDPYEPLPDQRDEARFLLGSCEEGRSWGRDSFLLRKFTSITGGGGGGNSSGSSLSRRSPPDLVLCLVDYREVVDTSSSGPKKAEASLLNEIRHLNHAVLAVQATPLLVVVSPSAELVVDAAERRRLASMAHLITVAGGVVPVVDNCSMVEAALTTYACARSEKSSRL